MTNFRTVPVTDSIRIGDQYLDVQFEWDRLEDTVALTQVSCCGVDVTSLVGRLTEEGILRALYENRGRMLRREAA